MNGIYDLTEKRGASARRTFRAMTLVEQIARTLRKDILTGNLRGGDQLLEEKLKSEFGVSRTPLREAFRVLEKEGLIEILPRKGAFVKRITRKDIEENFPVRAALEGVAARLAYSNISVREIKEMEEAMEYMENAVKRKDFGDYSLHHSTFHETFINASHNDILINLLKYLRMHTLWHRYTYHYYKEDFENSLKVHRQILNLFKRKKVGPEKIERLVRDHIERALQPFLSAMKDLEDELQT